MSKSIIVSQDGKKWVVLVNFIQVGCQYNDKASAEKEAVKLRGDCFYKMN